MQIDVELTTDQEAALAALAATTGETLDAFVVRMTRKMLIGHADAAVREKIRASAPAFERAYLAAPPETRESVLASLGLEDKGTVIVARAEPTEEPEAPTAEEPSQDEAPTRG